MFKPWLVSTYKDCATYKNHGWGGRMLDYTSHPMEVKAKYCENGYAGNRLDNSFAAVGCTWHSQDFISAPPTLIEHQKKIEKKYKPPKWWTDEFKPPQDGACFTTRWVFYHRLSNGYYDYHKYFNQRSRYNSYTHLKEGAPKIKYMGENSTACFASIHASYIRFYNKYKIWPNKVTYLRPKPTRNPYCDEVFKYYKLLKANGVLPPTFNCRRMAYQYNAGLDVTNLTLNQMFGRLAAIRVCSEKQAYYHALLWLINEKKMADFWIAVCAAASISKTSGHHWISRARMWATNQSIRYGRVDPLMANKLIKAAFGYRDFFQRIHDHKGTDMRVRGSRYNNYTEEVKRYANKYNFKKHYRLNDLLTLKLDEVKLD